MALAFATSAFLQKGLAVTDRDTENFKKYLPKTK